MQTNEVMVTKLILKSEGGYCNDAGDPGGPTNFGITIWDVRKYLKPNATADDVRALTLAQAIEIYDKHYWDAVCCDDWRSGLDYVIYDYAINSGVARPPRVLQAILGLPRTGQIDATLVARANASDQDKLIDAICDERLYFMHQIRGGDAWKRFGNGWGTRVASVRKTAHRLAAAKPEAIPAIVDAHVGKVGITPKATHVDPTLPNTITKATGVTGLGTGAAAGAASHDTLITFAVAGAVIVMIGGLGYLAYRNQHQKQIGVVLPPGMAGL